VKVDPEWIRAGRFSCVFYVGMPTKKTKEKIWDIWKRNFKIRDGDTIPDDKGWTGAEIFQCCENADTMGVSLIQASRYVTHTAKISADDLRDLENFVRETGIVHADEPDEEVSVEDVG
jgi:ATP-dependent 26S proteasome regulatory subunit